jgi:hypothetical protein
MRAHNQSPTKLRGGVRLSEQTKDAKNGRRTGTEHVKGCRRTGNVPARGFEIGRTHWRLLLALRRRAARWRQHGSYRRYCGSNVALDDG